jgi:hypothetical protein
MQHLRNAITTVASGKGTIFRREVTLDEAGDLNEKKRKRTETKGVYDWKRPQSKNHQNPCKHLAQWLSKSCPTG